VEASKNWLVMEMD